MQHKKKILIADHSESSCSLLSDILSPRYELLKAATGVEAVAILGRHYADIAAVLLNLELPEINGFGVLSIMNRNHWLHNLPVIIISDEVVSDKLDRAYELGATDYITRPFDGNTVIRRIQNSIILYTKQKHLENLVTEQIMEKERVNSQIVGILSNIVEFRNGEKEQHVFHIRIFTDLLLQSLRQHDSKYHLTAGYIALIVNAAAMHDIGKISIPEEILNKPAKLTKEEFEIMKSHTVIGAQILEKAPNYSETELLRVAHDICRWHHERYDGNGYPDGLKGEEIPIGAQVVGMADVYDALTNHRVYKTPFSHEKAMEMILSGECGVFSPLLLDCFLEIGDILVKELETRSPQTVSDLDVQRVASELMAHSELQISGRTVTLLEQERIKSRFFSALTKEIQFEYDRGTGILEFSEWGAQYLGIPELIHNPFQNLDLETWGTGAAEDMKRRLQETTPRKPIASCNYCLNVRNEPRWFKAVARTLWDSEEQPTFSRVIGKLVDIHEEQTKLNALKELAERDSLTVLYNRKTAQEKIEERLSDLQGRSYILVLIDLDFFKNANDIYGHVFGDSILKFVAHNIQSAIQWEDIGARIGGDEFLVFMECHGNEEELVEHIFHAVAKKYETFYISLSVGAARCPADGKEYNKLYHYADIALYAAKNSGKNRYCFYNKTFPDFPSELTPIDGQKKENKNFSDNPLNQEISACT